MNFRNHGDLLVHLLVRLPVPAEFYGRCQCGILPFLYDTCQVRVHEYVAEQVVQPEASGVVHILESPYREHVVRYVYTEPSGLCQYDGCGSFLPGPRQVPALGYLSGPFLSFAHITNGLHVYGCF